MSYADFLASKQRINPDAGLDATDLPTSLFHHQADVVRWAARRGRAAAFLDTGLGKTRIQLAWADVMRQGGRALIVCPLSIARQTAREGHTLGQDPHVVRRGDEVSGPGIYITNYEMQHAFDPADFAAVVLDESSILKNHEGRTRTALIERWGKVPYRLACTATPAPNDHTELANHAEFLGAMSRVEMLAAYFVHDDDGWRLKGHARHVFWQWVCNWGALVRRPSDLGFDDSAYELPKLHLHEHAVETEMPTNGMLFASEAQTLSERRDARRMSIADRVNDCARIVNADREPWIVWCDLNAEGDELRKAIPDAVEIRGSDDIEVKERRLQEFAAGQIRVLVTKPSIAGFGLNWQHCARMAFVGVTDSFESYYQAVRRCWRFGQKRDVHVHVFASSAEGAVIANLRRKERDALAMAESLSAETHDAVMAEVVGTKRQTNAYAANQAVMPPSFLVAA